MDPHSAMGDTIEYFVVTPVREKTYVVRVMRDPQDSSKYTANYAEDSNVFHRPVNNVTASDVILEEFVEKMKASRL